MSKITDRQQEAFQLRETGLSYADIGRQLGVSHTQARNDVQAVLAQAIHEVDNEARDLELARLDRLYLMAYNKALSGDLKAVDTALRISERRTALLALRQTDKPEQAVPDRVTVIDEIRERRKRKRG